MTRYIHASTRGALRNDGTAYFNPTHAAQLDLVDQVNVDRGALGFSVSAGGGLTGTLATQTGGSTLATFAAQRNVRGAPSALLNFPAAAPAKGIYSVVFPAGTPPPGAPQGDGYASLTLRKSGGVLLTGYLADGTRYTAAGVLRLDGTVPLFNALYAQRGVFAGTLAFADLPDSDVTGPDFVWFRSAATAGHSFRGGWPEGVQISALGAKYTALAAFDFGQGPSDIFRGNATLVFTDAASVTAPVDVSPTTGAVKLIATAPTPATLLFSPASGLFSGTVTHGLVTDQFGGILLHKGVNRGGFGYFLTTPRIVGAGVQSGGVSLQPRQGP